MNLRRIASALVAVALGVGLIGAGVSASWTDSATAAANVNVGTFACEITSATPSAIVSPDRHSVTFTEADIISSAPPQGGNALNLSIDLKATGSIPVRVHWTIVGPDYNNPPGGNFGTSSGSPSMTNDITLQPGQTQHYDSLGFMWLTPLTNADLQRTLTATYTAHCGELPPPSQHPSFVAGASAAGTSVALPSGWQPGDLAIAMAWNASSNIRAIDSGFTAIGSQQMTSNYVRSLTAYKVLASGDTQVAMSTTGTAAVWQGVQVLIYRHAAVASSGGIYLYTYGFAYNTGIPNNRINCLQPANGALPTDGTASVVCMAIDQNGATTNVRSIAPSGMSNRSSGFSMVNAGAADTAGSAVTSWPGAGTVLTYWDTNSTASRGHGAWSIGLIYAP
jgi:predicted ribosomally synthesized peptide with SipW-like signal peptide